MVDLNTTWHNDLSFQVASLNDAFLCIASYNPQKNLKNLEDHHAIF